MATENLDGLYSLPAAADLSASQYLWATINSSGQAALVSSTGTLPDGLIHNAPTSGKDCRLVIKTGVVVKVKLGGTVAIGDFLSVNGSGLSVKSVTSTHVRFGKFLDAGVSGDIVRATFMGYVGAVP